MKDNRTIEEQVSELTEEQRKLIPKIYKNQRKGNRHGRENTHKNPKA